MAKSTPINPATPLGSDDPKQADDRMRETKTAIVELMEVDHYMGANTGSGYDEDAAGEHAQATLHARTSPSAVEADKGVVFAKTVDSVAELFFIDENEAEVQLTRGGKMNLDKNILANDTPLQADDAAGTGLVDLIKAGRNEADDADVMILTDGARTDTNAAAAEDTGIINKKQLTDAINALSATKSFGVPAKTNSSGVNMVKGSVYKARQDGFVTAFSKANNSTDALRLYGLIGSTSSPTIEIASNVTPSQPTSCTITFPVKKDWYFKVNMSSTSVSSQNIYWHPIGAYLGPTLQ